MHWWLRPTHLCFRCSFDDVRRINFRFRLLVTWSSAHGRDASSCKIWCRYLYPMRSYWHFAEIKDGGRRHLGFSDYVNLAIRVCWRCGICVLYQIGLNICTGYWDRRTYASDVHLMTSRELTSGFDFLSRDHLCMAVMHLPVKFGADIFIQCGVIDILPKLKMAAATILDLLDGAMGPPTKAHSWCVLPVKISSWLVSSFQVIRVLNFCRSCLKVLFTPPKFEFLGSFTPKI